MRVHPWIVSILSGLALWAGGQAGLAQQGGLGSIPGGENAGMPLYPPSPAAPGMMGYGYSRQPIPPSRPRLRRRPGLGIRLPPGRMAGRAINPPRSLGRGFPRSRTVSPNTPMKGDFGFFAKTIPPADISPTSITATPTIAGPIPPRWGQSSLRKIMLPGGLPPSSFPWTPACFTTPSWATFTDLGSDRPAGRPGEGAGARPILAARSATSPSMSSICKAGPPSMDLRLILDSRNRRATG